MSQLEVDSAAGIMQQVAPLEQQLQKLMHDAQTAMQDPETQAMAKQDPQKAQQVMQQAQQQAAQLQKQIAELKDKPTIEKIMVFLKDQRLRPFVLDIETDSTIAPDENATKQRATEFITAVGGFMREAMPLAQTMPQSANLLAETLKYTASQFRAGRALEGSIEEFADQMKAVASQPKPPAPEQVKAEAEAKAMQADAMEKQANAQKMAQEVQSKTAQDDLDRRIREQEATDASQARQADLEVKRELGQQQFEQAQQKHAQAMDLGMLSLEKLQLEIERIKAEALKPAEAPESEKPPSESISFKDLPPEGQAQMAAQAGISISADAMQAHADAQDAKAADELKAKLAAKPKAKEPA